MIHATILRPEDMAERVNLNDYSLRLLAEGDSWFSLGSLPAHNLLEGLPFTRSAAVLNLAYPGDTLDGMLRGIQSFGGRLSEWLGPGNVRWDAILLSGGGNDLIQALPALLQAGSATSVRSWVNRARLDELLSRITSCHADLIAMRDAEGSPNAGVPVFTHTYDYPVPSDSPALAFGLPVAGPWLLPALRAVGAPSDMHMSITRYLIDRVAETLLNAASSMPNMHVIDTRWQVSSWENEIHPSAAGYAPLAAAMSEAIEQIV